MLAAAGTRTPTIHLSTTTILAIAGVLVLAALGRYLDERHRAQRLAARKQRQREYRRYLKSDGWRQRRTAAVGRSGGFCEDCGPRRDLDVHHRTYARKGSCDISPIGFVMVAASSLDTRDYRVSATSSGGSSRCARPQVDQPHDVKAAAP